MAKRKTKPEPVKEPVVEPKVAEKPIVEPKEVAKVTSPKWIKVTPEELDRIQKDHKLMGYKPSTGEALVK